MQSMTWVIGPPKGKWQTFEGTVIDAIDHAKQLSQSGETVEVTECNGVRIGSANRGQWAWSTLGRISWGNIDGLQAANRS